MVLLLKNKSLLWDDIVCLKSDAYPNLVNEKFDLTKLKKSYNMALQE